jgi:hypothetical protein
VTDEIIAYQYLCVVKSVIGSEAILTDNAMRDNGDQYCLTHLPTELASITSADLGQPKSLSSYHRMNNSLFTY